MISERQSPRKVADRILSIQIEPNNQAIVLNISDEGLGFHALRPVTQLGSIHFSYSENGEKIEASGELVWTDSSKKSGGLSFASLPRESRERIREWVERAGVPDSTAATPQSATPRGNEYSPSGVGPRETRGGPLPNAPPPGTPLPQPAISGFALFEDDPRTPQYDWDQQLAFPSAPTKFFRGFVTGAIASAILSAILFFTYGSSTSFMRARVGEAASPQVAPNTAPHAPAQPPTGSPVLPTSSGLEAPAVSTLPDSPAISKSIDTATRPANGPSPLKGINAESDSMRAPQSPPVKSADSGDADLALAQRYLSDSRGPGSSAAAVHLLWGSVEKGNVNAEITLADLYARGVGVAKSCDQARVLLRAAAGKGGSEASQELAQIIRRGCR